MSAARGDSYDLIQLGLNSIVRNLARQLSLDVAIVEAGAAQSFVNLWDAIRQKYAEVVVLVDEYDIPLQGFLDKPDEFEKVRQLLHDFYLQLKPNANLIRFLMLTGVTKITKLSIFSGLNTLVDITLDADYASLLGVSE